MPKHEAIERSLRQIFQGIETLQNAFDGKRKFTIDGRLVGDIGEVLAELEYDIELDEKSRPKYDAVTKDGKHNVQIKATFKDSLTFSSEPDESGLDYYLGLKLLTSPDENGKLYREIYNGSSQVIFDHYKDKRKWIGQKLLSFPIKKLQALNERVQKESPDNTVKRRQAP